MVGHSTLLSVAMNQWIQTLLILSGADMKNIFARVNVCWQSACPWAAADSRLFGFTIYFSTLTFPSDNILAGKPGWFQKVHADSELDSELQIAAAFAVRATCCMFHSISRSKDLSYSADLFSQLGVLPPPTLKNTISSSSLVHLSYL